MNVFFISNAPTQCEIPVQDLMEKEYSISGPDEPGQIGTIKKDNYQFQYIGSLYDLASIIEEDSADFYRFLKQFRSDFSCDLINDQWDYVEELMNNVNSTPEEIIAIDNKHIEKTNEYLNKKYEEYGIEWY